MVDSYNEKMNGPSVAWLLKKGIFIIGIIIIASFTLLIRMSVRDSCPSYNSRVPGDAINPTEASSEDGRFRAEVVTTINRQTFYFSDGLDLYMHSAFFDDRFHESLVRVFGLQFKDVKHGDFVCQWTQNKGLREVIVEVPARKFMIDTSWPNWSKYFGCNFDCHFKKGSRPKFVTLRSKDGKYTYSDIPVEIEETRHSRKYLGVCVKPVTGQFGVGRLLEWFEIQRLAGIDDFIVYDTDVQGPARYVLEYYEKLGVLQIVSFPFLMAMLQVIDVPATNLSPQERYALYQQVYLVAMQDCLYRFMNKYEHILFIDLDEVVLPTNNVTVQEMLRNVRKTFTRGAGFIFMTAWHFEEFGMVDTSPAIADYLYMQKYAKATLPIPNQPKSIVVTDVALSVNFHSLLDVPEQKYSNEEIPWEKYGYTHHYRGLCSQKFEDYRCLQLLQSARTDPVLTRYRPQLTERVGKIMNQLKLH